jgi:hypothetical protein
LFDPLDLDKLTPTRISPGQYGDKARQKVFEIFSGEDEMALHSSSYETMYEDHGSKPPKRKESSMIVVLLFVAAALVAAFFIPGVRARVSKYFPTDQPKKVEMGAKVWADKQAGTYYCADSHFFGHGTGTYMKQGDALTLGYQPALGNYCQEGQPAHSKTLDQARGHLAPAGGATSSHSAR